MDSDPAFERRPNVLLVHPHDLGRRLGCYGAAVETPAIDSLAADGVRFDQHVCTAPQCSPSRGSMVSGRYPHDVGLLGLAHLGWGLDDEVETLPELLGDAGYETRLFGVQHEVVDPERLGYDDHWTESELAADVAEATVDFLDDPPDDPFFASVGFFEPHRLSRYQGFRFDDPRYDAPAPDAVDPPDYLPDVRAVREELAAFYGMVRAVDDAVGRILDRLEAAGLREETLVVFTTDHGPAFPRAKGTLYEAGVGTALLAAHPALPDGAVRDELLSNVDLLPTLLDVAGGDVPPEVDGQSFAPLLWGDGEGKGDGEAYDGRDEAFLEMTFHDKYNPTRGVRTERYKYVRSFGDLPLVYLPMDVLQSPSGRALYERFYTSARPAEELYDLDADPLEQENLIDDPEHAEVADRLRARVDAWMERTDDPLLDGDVPVPPEHVERMKTYPWG
ncbi:sulfatase family protein [Candidatus Halobonum tyrrellensis]|uniref:N-sulfoglucosamine sulfohydrolase n=1 Tax=Candidatus Halobonum tyrrellensis G22 TaxID=1324957 RepID=V4IY04_9EURY|nr:sulfatase [Candidatus Halobonum tyrrellensis]ESP88042.1 N-sulfoglucosamine sulfohydrolase [Candidatus Halobonum tyrrellensis G22]